jgi:hypothetical protein
LNAAGYLGAVLSVAELGVKQFHALRPPKADEPLYGAFLRELDRNTKTSARCVPQRQRETARTT